MAAAITFPGPRLASTEAPPQVLFTRMTPTAGCCLQCASPHMFVAEDFSPVAWRFFGRRRPKPTTYLQCGTCGSQDQSDD